MVGLLLGMGCAAYTLRLWLSTLWKYGWLSAAKADILLEGLKARNCWKIRKDSHTWLIHAGLGGQKVLVWLQKASSSRVCLLLSTSKRVRPCSSMSGTKFSIGLGGRGLKALCGKATSWGQSSAEGTPTTLHKHIFPQMNNVAQGDSRSSQCGSGFRTVRQHKIRH